MRRPSRAWAATAPRGSPLARTPRAAAGARCPPARPRPPCAPRRRSARRSWSASLQDAAATSATTAAPAAATATTAAVSAHPERAPTSNSPSAIPPYY
eukprot:scaffold37454_cov72-Phaeocystis_antarctica.AAC.2